MHHLVYIPKAHLSGLTTAEQLAAVGLADHAAGAKTIPLPEGPDGGSGTLYGWGERLHFNTAEQSWSAAARRDDLPAGRYWVGTFNASPPTPEDLRRPGRDPWGLPIVLGGHSWLLTPVDFIPKVIAQLPDGTTGLRVKPEYAALADDRLTWVARLKGPPTLLPLIDAVRFVVATLALNYRIDLTLALHLGLFDEENIQDAMLLALRPRGYYLENGGA